VTTATARVEARGITVLRRGRPVVRDVSLTLEPGITALVGPNGAGKSTLMRVLATVSRPSHGRLLVGGRVVRRSARRAYRRSLGYLPQDATWHDWMTVEETVRLFAWLHGLRGADIGPAVGNALEAADLRELRGRRSGRLSGGEHQRLMLATAIAHRPDVLILDEPTVGLDPGQRIHFRKVLHGIGDSTAVLMSTHLLDDIARSARCINVLSEGCAIFNGTPSDLAARGQDASDGISAVESGYLAVLQGGHQ
jgi:ABC-2 type transport system ATP-binding protein